MATLSDELLDLIKGLHATEEEVKQAKGKQEDLKKANQSRFINMLNKILLIVMLSTVGNDVLAGCKELERNPAEAGKARANRCRDQQVLREDSLGKS